MRHQNLRALRDQVLWHIVAKGSRTRTRCGRTIKGDWTLIAFPTDRMCLKCYQSWEAENGAP